MKDVPSPLRLSLQGPAGRLAARLETPSKPVRRAVIAHPHPLYGGTMDNAVVRAAARRLLGAGAAVLTFDFRGVGESEGAFDDGVGEQLDLLAAEAELARRFAGLPHWLLGYSFGAFVALSRLGSGDGPEVEAVVALAPPLSHREWAPPEACTPPLALITGELDGLTPEAGIRSFEATHPTIAHHEVLPGAGHDLGTAGRPGVGALEAALDRAIGALTAQ